MTGICLFFVVGRVEDNGMVSAADNLVAFYHLTKELAMQSDSSGAGKSIPLTERQNEIIAKLVLITTCYLEKHFMQNEPGPTLFEVGYFSAIEIFVLLSKTLYQNWLVKW